MTEGPSWQFLHCCQFFWGGYSAGKLIDIKNTRVKRKSQLILQWDADRCAEHFADSLQTLKGSDSAFRLWVIIIMDRIQNPCYLIRVDEKWQWIIRSCPEIWIPSQLRQQGAHSNFGRGAKSPFSSSRLTRLTKWDMYPLHVSLCQSWWGLVMLIAMMTMIFVI